MPDFTTNGVPYADTNDMVNVPATGQLLAGYLDPFVPNWQAPRQARQVARAATIFIASDSAWHPVSGFELGSTFSVGVSYAGGVYTINKAGLYLVSATVLWPPVSTGPVRLFGEFYTATGTGGFAADAYYRGRADLVSTAAVPYSQYQTYTGIIPFSAGDQVQLYLYADTPGSGVTLTPTTFTVAALA